MRDMLAKVKYLTHVNFSGMNLKKKQVFSLITILKQFYYMVSIHLSDNGITKDDEFYYDCLEEF